MLAITKPSRTAPFFLSLTTARKKKEKAPRPFASYLSGISVGKEETREGPRFTPPKDGDCQYLPGIPWGPAQVFEAFDFLANVVEGVGHLKGSPPPAPQQHPDAVLTAISPPPPHDDTEQLLYQTMALDAPPVDWFLFDFDDIAAEVAKKAPLGTSWYSRLRDVCDRTMELLLTLHFGIPADPSKPMQRQKWSDDFVTKKLQCSVTAPRQSLNPSRKGKSATQYMAFQPFPVDEGALIEVWRESYVQAGLLDQAPPTAAAAGIKSLRAGEPAPLSAEALDRASRMGQERTARTLMQVQSGFAEQRHPVPEMNPLLFGNVASYPQYVDTPAPLDPFILKFVSSNIHGQFHIMGERLKTEFLRLCFLRQQLDVEMKQTVEEMNTLDSQYLQYQNENAEFERAAARWQDANKEKADKEKRVQEARRIRDQNASFADFSAGRDGAMPTQKFGLDAADSSDMYGPFDLLVHMG
jgi:hypothetical protein